MSSPPPPLGWCRVLHGCRITPPLGTAGESRNPTIFHFTVMFSPLFFQAIQHTHPKQKQRGRGKHPNHTRPWSAANTKAENPNRNPQQTAPKPRPTPPAPPPTTPKATSQHLPRTLRGPIEHRPYTPRTNKRAYTDLRCPDVFSPNFQSHRFIRVKTA